MDWKESLVLTFIPLFIVIDAVGTIPFVMVMSEGVTRPYRRRMVHTAIVTGTIVGLAFLFFGQFILQVMGISSGSFAIAGGIILLVLSIRYIVTGHIVDIAKEEMVAVVPIGTPLTVGPATITTLLLLNTQYPLWIVLLSFILNMLIAWAIFQGSNEITRFLGQGGIKAISKVFSLLLEAIAVTMVFRGLDLLGIMHISG
jgi:multiple antibiotic resistance protein